MTFEQALMKISYKYRAYFRWKFNIKDGELTEQEFLKSKVGTDRTMKSFKDWERTPEYANLVALYLESKIANDLYDTYMNVSEKAKEGDEKSVKLLLQLTKEIQSITKQARNSNSSKKEDTYSLELD